MTGAERVGLYGIGCPKSGSHSERAWQFTGDVAFGRIVTDQVKDGDCYGRNVREVILPEGRNLNRELVRQYRPCPNLNVLSWLGARPPIVAYMARRESPGARPTSAR